jgi:hypothetical protein
MTVNETARTPRSRRTLVVIVAIAVGLGLIVAALLVSARLVADAEAKDRAVFALETANATLQSLAQGDARAEYDATLKVAQSYSEQR